MQGAGSQKRSSPLSTMTSTASSNPTSAGEFPHGSFRPSMWSWCVSPTRGTHVSWCFQGANPQCRNEIVETVLKFGGRETPKPSLLNGKAKFLWLDVQRNNLQKDSWSFGAAKAKTHETCRGKNTWTKTPWDLNPQNRKTSSADYNAETVVVSKRQGNELALRWGCWLFE